jgi:hypothetical protein
MWASENSRTIRAAVLRKRPESITVGCNGQAILTMAGTAYQHAAWIESYLLRGRDGLDSATLARMGRRAGDADRGSGNRCGVAQPKIGSRAVRFDGQMEATC